MSPKTSLCSCGSSTSGADAEIAGSDVEGIDFGSASSSRDPKANRCLLFFIFSAICMLRPMAGEGVHRTQNLGPRSSVAIV